MIRKLFFISSLLALFSFNACIQFSESLILEKDASTDFRFTLALSNPPEDKKGKASKEDRKFQENIAMIRNSIPSGIQFDQKQSNEFGLTKVQFQLKSNRFADLEKFYLIFTDTLNQKVKKQNNENVKNKKKPDELGDIFVNALNQKSFFKIKKTNKGTLRISRSFKPGKIKEVKKKKDDKKADMGEGFAKMIVAMFEFRFEFVSPSKIIDSNAHEQLGQLLRWETNAAYLSKKPFEVWVEIEASPEMLAAF